MDFSPTALYCKLHDDLGSAGIFLPEAAAVPDSVGTAVARSGCAPVEFAALHLLKSIISKYHPGDEPTKEAQQAAVDNFLRCNEVCRQYDYGAALAAMSQDERSIDHAVSGILEKALLAWDGLRFTWEDVCEHAYFGPGTSYGSDDTPLYHKLSREISCTGPALYRQWWRDRGEFKLEFDAEVERLAIEGGSLYKIVPYSKLSCVKKKVEIARTICAGPSINGFYQLGVGVCVERLLLDLGIDLAKQQAVNRSLARMGSATGRITTIDLRSASDLISRSIVRAKFPAVFTGLLEDLREPATLLPSGEVVELHMISSMGNGFTFPVQTMLFVAVVLAVYQHLGIRARGCDCRAPNYGVNGDDIAVVTEAGPLVMRMLCLYGFAVNEDKTFSTGLFRESCGGDYYRGYFVRGVYCKSSAQKQDIVSLINRLVEWSGRWDVPLRATVGYLQSFARGAYLVPRWDQDTSGIKVPFSFIDTSSITRCADTGAILYRRWAARPKTVDLIGEQQWNPKNFTREEYRELTPAQKAKVRRWRPINWSFFILCSVQGSIRNGSVTLRSYRVNYESRVAACPGWDVYYDPQWRDLSKPAVGRRAFERACCVNLAGFMLTPG